MVVLHFHCTCADISSASGHVFARRLCLHHESQLGNNMSVLEQQKHELQGNMDSVFRLTNCNFCGPRLAEFDLLSYQTRQNAIKFIWQPCCSDMLWYKITPASYAKWNKFKSRNKYSLKVISKLLTVINCPEVILLEYLKVMKISSEILVL